MHRLDVDDVVGLLIVFLDLLGEDPLALNQNAS